MFLFSWHRMLATIASIFALAACDHASGAVDGGHPQDGQGIPDADAVTPDADASPGMGCLADSLGELAVGGSLPVRTESAAIVELNGYVYLLGGWREDRGPLDEVHVAPVGVEGLGAWSSLSGLPRVVQHHGAFGAGRRVYVVGGDGGAGEAYRAVSYAEQHADGSLGAWVESALLPAPRSAHALVTTGSQVYALGGVTEFAGTEPVSESFFAGIGDDGELTEWRAFTLPEPGAHHGAVELGGRLYVMGGLGAGGSLRRAADIATLDPSGAPSSWERAEFPVGLFRFAAVALDDAILVLGGASGTGGTTQTVLARVSSDDGRLSEWERSAPLPEPRFATAVTRLGSRIYVAGGFPEAFGSPVDTVFAQSCAAVAR
jgi:hypothetical protein